MGINSWIQYLCQFEAQLDQILNVDKNITRKKFPCQFHCCDDIGHMTRAHGIFHIDLKYIKFN